MLDEGKKIYEGPTIGEIYQRQSGKCWLEAEFDEINGKMCFGDLFCTDGNIKYPTSALLNPSSECIKCLVDYIIRLFEDADE